MRLAERGAVQRTFRIAYLKRRRSLASLYVSYRVWCVDAVPPRRERLLDFLFENLNSIGAVLALEFFRMPT